MNINIFLFFLISSGNINLIIFLKLYCKFTLVGLPVHRICNIFLCGTLFCINAFVMERFVEKIRKIFLAKEI